MRYLPAFILLLLMACHSVQPVRLNTATTQDWSGGIAGYHGSNYFIELLSPIRDTITPDSIYLHNGAHHLVNSHNAIKEAFWFRWTNNQKPVIRISVRINYSHMSYDERAPKTAVAAIAPGQALLTYYQKGKKRSMRITHFETMPAVNYP